MPRICRLASFSYNPATLYRRVSTVSNASCRPKSKQAQPTITTTDLRAGRMAVGVVGDEESASIDDRLESVARGRSSGRCQRL